MSKHAYLTEVVVGKRSSMLRESAATLQEPSLTLKGTVQHLKALVPPRYSSGCYTIRFSVDGSYLLAGYDNGAVQLYDKEAQGVFAKPTVLRKGSRHADDAIMNVRFHPKDKQYAYSCCVQGTVYRHHLTSQVPDERCFKFCDETSNKINAIDLNMTGERLATGGKDLHIRVYDTTTRALETTLAGFSHLQPRTELGGHALSVFCIKFHNEHRDMLLSGGWDDTVKIWDLRSGGTAGMVGSLGGPHICGDAIDLRGDVVLTGSWSAHGAIQLWDLRERRPIKTLGTEHSSELQGDNLYAVQFARTDPNGHHVLTAGSGTNSFQYINHNTSKVIGSGTSEKPFHTVDSFGRTLAAAGGDSWIRLLHAPKHKV